MRSQSCTKFCSVWPQRLKCCACESGFYLDSILLIIIIIFKTRPFFFWQFGVSFAQKGFKVTPETKFRNEPLQSLMTKEVPDGLFFAVVTKFASNCGNNSHCKFSKILMGKDSWLKFHGGVNRAGVNVKAGVYGIPIKGDLKFNKVELFVEVRTSSCQ